ncbi:MAG: outer membrane lipoprotein-sorting protein [Nitrospirae bacterium]|nr:outer membrane lipoprotein-sorting protein [Nitrospirota bacterium]
MKMKECLMVVFFLVFLLGFNSNLSIAASPDPEKVSAQEIITRSDQVRNPAKPFRMMSQLIEYDGGVARNELTLIIFSKEDKELGQYKTLVRYIEPLRDFGKLVLMNGSQMWFFDPSSKASVRISPQQRLIGQASEGDVVTVNLATDYKAELLGTETLDDADRKPKICWHLDLAPARDDTIYSRVEYWVEQGTFYPVKGKFYADSGRLLKIAYYHRYKEQLDTKRPGEVIIIDAVNTRQVTTMNFSDYRYQEIPEAWFQREFLPHLKIE